MSFQLITPTDVNRKSTVRHRLTRCCGRLWPPSPDYMGAVALGRARIPHTLIDGSRLLVAQFSVVMRVFIPGAIRRRM